MSYDEVDVLFKHSTPDTATHVRGNPLVAALSQGRAGPAEVARVVVGEFHAHAAEVAAFATLAARCPVQPVAGYFVDLARLVLDCEAPLLACAEALGLSEQELRHRQPARGMRDFGSFMSWLAMRAGPAEAAGAVRADLLLWCGSCAALADELTRHEAPLPQPVIDYFSLFQTPPERFIEEAREVAAYGLAQGEEPAAVERGIAQVEPVLSRFWAAAVQPSASTN
ncbi:hypothetical protein AB0B50_27870 [Streptomyces sp. NPDC041068]|uniref:hypothetical protein n=1 Tax=Streptomyces sp. NPDC041068 TaxID=3155130 RepID=UPI00340D65C1